MYVGLLKFKYGWCNRASVFNAAVMSSCSKDTQQGRITVSRVAAVTTYACPKIHSGKDTLTAIKDILEQSSGRHTDLAVAVTTSSPKATSTEI